MQICPRSSIRSFATWALPLVLASISGCASESPVQNAPFTPASKTPIEPSHVRVDGDVPRPTDFDRAALERLGTETIVWAHDDESHSFRGVTLFDVLKSCGFESGPGGRDLSPRDRRRGWGQIVIARGDDGYVTVFSCAELDPELGPATRSILAWEMDGQPLPADQGQFRLVTPTDKRGFRSVRRLVRLEVLDVRQLPRD